MIRGGKSYVSSPPAFSNDAKKLLVCAANTVAIFSTDTGLQIASLEGHTALVTAVIVVPAWNPASKILCYCWTASLDGTIRYWDFSAPALLKTVNVHLQVFSMVIPSFFNKRQEVQDSAHDLLAYVSVEDSSVPAEGPNKLCGQIRRCNLTKFRMPRGETLKETEEPESITASPSGEFFGIRSKCKLHIWKVPSAKSKHNMAKMMTLHHTKIMTVLAFHPTQKIVAAGDVTGRILIWRGFGCRTFAIGNELGSGRSMDDKEEKPGVRGNDDADSCTTWHWHPAEVNILMFSSDGAYLYSGGKEGVLVVWQLDTGKKKFLPRIGSPLLYFTCSPDPSLSSISCADNRIHLLKMPSMGIWKSISGIKLPCLLPEICEGLSSRVAFDQMAGLVALCTEDYRVQLYSLFDDREISEVQVCERNHHPGDSVTVVVTTVALSLDGSIMTTAEVKLAEEGIGGLVCLKFWMLDSQDKLFSLSTIVYEPHRDAGISDIAFHPARCMAVSSSYGGDFKIWVCNSEIQQKSQTLQASSWTCHAVGSYKKRQMTAAAFSGDGSVLAVAAETVITLWNPDKNVLLAVVGETHTPIVSLSFVGKSEYVVATSQGSKPQLSVWNMSKLSSSWSYKLFIEGVACTWDLSSFAVLALLPESSNCIESKDPVFHGRDGVILLFNATDPIPVTIWFVTKAEGGALSFVKPNQSFLQENAAYGKPPQTLLAYVNGDHEYVVFDPYSDETSEVTGMHQGAPVDHGETGKFGYASMYGELPKFELKSNNTSRIQFVSSGKPWDTIFSGSSHNLPPLTKLCKEFLESLLERRTPVE